MRQLMCLFFCEEIYLLSKVVQLANEVRAEGKLICIMPCKEEEDAVNSVL